jgi:hypothetical protein
MKYYKEKEVEVKKVKKYEITKMRCDHCGELITTEDPKYCRVCVFPRYPEDDAYLDDVHKKCLCDYLTNGLDNICLAFDDIRIEYDEFSPYTSDHIDEYFDAKDVDEELDEVKEEDKI